MYDDICYDQPFLKEVIVRVDFSSPLDALASTIPPKVSNAALACFPVSEPRKALAQELQLSANAVQHRRQEFTEWNYYGRDREKRLMISPAVIFATYSRYSTYEVLKDDFLSVLSVLFPTFPDLRASRLVLRYINHIETNDGNPLHWNEYVDERLLGLFARFTDREHVSRFSTSRSSSTTTCRLSFSSECPTRISRPLSAVPSSCSTSMRTSKAFRISARFPRTSIEHTSRYRPCLKIVSLTAFGR